MTTPAPPQPAAILDQQEGLERLMGDRPQYLQILRRFRRDYREAAGAVRLACASGDMALAQRTAHTLKGAAGMIGARAVYLLTVELELACAAARPMDAQLAQLTNALTNALAGALAALDTEIDALQDAPADTPASPATPAGDAPDAGLLLTRLAQLLEDGDGAAIDLLEQSASVLAASLGVERFQQVAAAAHQFDFEAALQALVPGH